MDIQTIVAIIIYIVIAILGVIYSIVCTIKGVKRQKDFTALDDDVELKIVSLDAIVAAEQFYAPFKKMGMTETGPMKKQQVMQTIQTYALTHNMTYDENEMSAYVEKILGITKVVN